MGDWEVDVYLNRNSLILGNGIGCRIQLEILTQPVHVTYSNRKPGDLWGTFYL